MIVKTKFVCQDKTHDTQTPEQGQVRLMVVTTGSEENEEYFAYTPSGSLQLGLLNAVAFDFFEPGKEYLVEIKLAE